ncbi:unnamed protein product [Tenebrio molitor]|nr:unnamed protein product [Tenebrio molitor]
MFFLSPKLWFVVKNGDKVKRCIHYFDNELVTSMNEGHDKIIDKWVKSCRRNSLVYFISCNICSSAWFIKSFFREDISELPLDVWNPFKENDRSIFYYSLYVSLSLGIFHFFFFCISIEPLIAGLIHHGATQLRVLKRNLRYLDEYVENKIHNSLTSAIYMSKWYDYTPQSKKALLILMERCKRPINITAGKVLEVSLETFILILKRSYSLLAVLKSQ